MKMRKMSTVGKQKLAPTGSRWLEDEEYVVYLEDISKPYWRRDTKLQYVGQWPVGGPAANPAIGGEKGIGGIEYFRGLRDDFKRKSQFYASDWLDGFRGGGKSLAAVCFLYFACLAPVVAFGGAMGSLTQVGPASPTSHPSPISPYLPPTSHVPPPTSHLPPPTSHLSPPPGRHGHRRGHRLLRHLRHALLAHLWSADDFRRPHRPHPRLHRRPV